MHQNRHIFKFCRQILRTIFLTILVNLGLNGHLWIETLGIETIFAQLRHISIRRTQLYQNPLFPANMRQNQAFWATVHRATQWVKDRKKSYLSTWFCDPSQVISFWHLFEAIESRLFAENMTVRHYEINVAKKIRNPLHFEKYTGWCEIRGTVLLLNSEKTEMTETIEIGLKIFPQHFLN